jgi:hypothetical protein
VPPFDEIRAIGPMKVVVMPGPDPRITLVGEAGRVRGLHTRVEKVSGIDRLRIEAALPEAGEAGPGAANPPSLEVRIVVPRLTGVLAERGAMVEIRDVASDSLTLTARDASTFAVSGTTRRLNAAIFDAGRLDASRLETRDAQVAASGSAVGIVRATESLSVMSSGDARVEYFGTPARINQVLSDRSRLTPR